MRQENRQGDSAFPPDDEAGQDALEANPGYAQFKAAFDRSAAALEYIQKWSRTWYLLLMMSIVAGLGVGVRLGWEPSIIGTVPLIGATVALVIATHTLGHYGTNQAYLLSGSEMALFLVRHHFEKERLDRQLAFEERRDRRLLLEGRLTKHFGPNWIEAIERTADNQGHVTSILEPFGTDFPEATLLFPELRRLADAPEAYPVRPR